jgi:hypothetical protein
MANRWLQQFLGTFDKKVVKLFGTITIGNTGAVSSYAGNGVASVSRTSQGLYKITLSDKYSALLSFQAIHLGSTGEDLTFQVKAADVASAKTIDVFTNAAATATDPAATDVIYFEVTLRNSSLTK